MEETNEYKKRLLEAAKLAHGFYNLTTDGIFSMPAIFHKEIREAYKKVEDLVTPLEFTVIIRNYAVYKANFIFGYEENEKAENVVLPDELFV